MAIKIRKAETGDLKTLARFEQELIRAERPMDPTIKPDPVTYYDLQELISNPEVHFLVAEIDNKVIACGYARPKPARPYLDHTDYAYLGFMYTDPEYRGKGINKLLMEHLEHWAGKQGLNELRLTVYTENYPAIRAYEKAGFAKHLIEMRYRRE
ncbi:N-acetyltransferase family protein [Zeaxanthinibacter enoshimensis]|uniref:GNAT family N-acetyltransferase n=1 Tax=Zeaxanthinibacter enoshimensis TaxID=392009 RepID=UPI00356A9811